MALVAREIADSSSSTHSSKSSLPCWYGTTSTVALALSLGSAALAPPKGLLFWLFAIFEGGGLPRGITRIGGMCWSANGGTGGGGGIGCTSMIQLFIISCVGFRRWMWVLLWVWDRCGSVVMAYNLYKYGTDIRNHLFDKYAKRGK